jgi:hypothetical protein
MVARLHEDAPRADVGACRVSHRRTFADLRVVVGLVELVLVDE